MNPVRSIRRILRPGVTPQNMPLTGRRKKIFVKISSLNANRAITIPARENVRGHLLPMVRFVWTIHAAMALWNTVCVRLACVNVRPSHVETIVVNPPTVRPPASSHAIRTTTVFRGICARPPFPVVSPMPEITCPSSFSWHRREAILRGIPYKLDPGMKFLLIFQSRMMPISTRCPIRCPVFRPLREMSFTRRPHKRVRRQSL